MIGNMKLPSFLPAMDYAKEYLVEGRTYREE